MHPLAPLNSILVCFLISLAFLKTNKKGDRLENVRREKKFIIKTNHKVITSIGTLYISGRRRNPEVMY